MKIAFSSKGKDLQADMDPRLGRAQQIIIFDTETNGFTVLDNDKGISALHGSGLNMAQVMSTNNVDAVITGQCGPKALNALTAAKISVYNTDVKKISDALDSYLRGSLTQVNHIEV